MLAEAAGKEQLGAKCYCSARLYKNTKIKIWHLGVVCLRVCRQSRGWSLVKYAHTVTYKIIILTVNKATVRASAPQSYNWKRRELNSSFIIQMSLSSVRPINTSLPVPFLNPLSFFNSFLFSSSFCLVTNHKERWDALSFSGCQGNLIVIPSCLVSSPKVNDLSDWITLFMQIVFSRQSFRKIVRQIWNKTHPVTWKWHVFRD